MVADRRNGAEEEQAVADEKLEDWAQVVADK